MVKGKNILVVINSLRRGGGAERVAAQIGSGLAKENNVTFVTFTSHSDLYDFSGDYICLDDGGRVTSSLAAFWALFRRAKQVADIARAKETSSIIAFQEEAGFPAVLSQLFYTSQVIPSVRNNPLKKGKKARWLIKLLYPFADTVVACSRGIQHLLREKFSLTNTTTIYNPVDFAGIRKKAQADLPPAHERFYSEAGTVFINMGRMEKQKGQWHLIRAFAQAVKEKPDTRLVILGDGSLRQQLAVLAKRCGVGEKVLMPGRVDNVFPYLAQADCFVMTSLWEGLPNALLETLAVGTPVVSTDCKTGPREILAPELKIDDKIKYPYHIESNTLVSVMNGAKLFSCPKDAALTHDELRLAKEMVQVSNRLTKIGFKNNEHFGIISVINEWKKVTELA